METANVGVLFTKDLLCYCSGAGHHRQIPFQPILIMLYALGLNMQLHKVEMEGSILQVVCKQGKIPEQRRIAPSAY